MALLKGPVKTRADIVEATSFIFTMCYLAGAELKTCYMVAYLFATGLEQECLSPERAGE